MDMVRTTRLGTDFLDSALESIATAHFGPYEIKGEEIRGRANETSRFISGLDKEIDAFCRYANAAGDPAALLAFSERWGLLNDAHVQSFEEVDAAARQMAYVVAHVERFNEIAAQWTWDQSKKLMARHSFHIIRGEVLPSLQRLSAQPSQAKMDYQRDDEGVFEVGLWTEAPADLTLLDGLRLQAVRAVFVGEEIKRCKECKGSFVYQTPRPGVSGAFRRRQAEFCTWNHAKRYGARERRRKGARS